MKELLYKIGTRAFALLAFCCLLSCETSDTTELPSLQGDKVAVNLALCVSPTQPLSGAITRQSETVAQVQDYFRGIKDIEDGSKLLTLIPLSHEGNVFDYVIPDFTEKQTTETYRHYLASNTDLYIGTEKFLCYAKATPLTADDEADVTKRAFKNGSITATLRDKKPKNITFDLKPTSTGDYAVADNLAEYLTSIANDDNWQTLDEGNGKFLSYYTSLINAGSKIAGSSANIRALVNELYQAIRNVPISSSDEYTALRTARTNILNRIITDVYHTGSDDNLVITRLDGTKTREGYPGDIGLPDGAAAMIWDNNNSKFVNITTSSVAGAPLSDHTRFVYPAELYYYSYGNIKTSTSSHADAYTSKVWDEKNTEGETIGGVLSDYENDEATVASTTRSVAIKEPLNYAVGCLVAKIMANATLDESSNKWYLEDNTYDTPKHVNLVNSDGEPSFPLTAILVGGQYQQLYNFVPVSDPTSSTATKPTEYIIYDREVVSGITLTQPTTDAEIDALTPTYTIVFQSRDDKPVDIVLEFTNNSDDNFMGLGGIVYKGTKFYLIGQVWPQSTRPEDEWHRVFTKDHKTFLNLNISSLKNAYNVIPDLKTAQYAVKVANVAVKSWVDAGIKTSDLYNW